MGRDLKRTIIIDNISDNFILQPDNGIFISTWYDDMQDNFLKDISQLLVELVEELLAQDRHLDEVLSLILDSSLQLLVAHRWLQLRWSLRLALELLHFLGIPRS